LTNSLHVLPYAALDAPEVDSLRARYAVEHVREVGADVVDRGYSLAYWANNALVGFGDEDAERQLDEAHPLPEDWDEQQAKLSAQLDERFAAMTTEVVLIVDEVDLGLSGPGRLLGQRPLFCGGRYRLRGRGVQPVHLFAVAYADLRTGPFEPA
jgi:hypothetical protein